jgi:hypothetical protein
VLLSTSLSRFRLTPGSKLRTAPRRLPRACLAELISPFNRLVPVTAPTTKINPMWTQPVNDHTRRNRRVRTKHFRWLCFLPGNAFSPAATDAPRYSDFAGSEAIQGVCPYEWGKEDEQILSGASGGDRTTIYASIAMVTGQALRVHGFREFTKLDKARRHSR